jgi:NAD(P)-dependent dehydrogenase (short-subunit alcohol dehydrogenase family)
MDLYLKNKHVLITGGSKGIGLACANAFLEEGCKVTIISRNQSDIKNVTSLIADLAVMEQAESAVQSAISANGDIDILVNCAGAAKKVAPFEVTPKNYMDAMQAKFFTYINSMYAVLPKMKKGSIVNVVGLGGKVAFSSHLTGGAANAALLLTSMGMANVYIKKGIRINCVNPVATRTGILEQAISVDMAMNAITRDEALDKVKSRFPNNRILEPEEVADTVLFLASDRSSYINGSCIYVDGGSLSSI